MPFYYPIRARIATLWLMSSDTRLFILCTWRHVSLPVSQPKGRFYDFLKSIGEIAGVVGLVCFIMMPSSQLTNRTRIFCVSGWPSGTFAPFLGLLSSQSSATVPSHFSVHYLIMYLLRFGKGGLPLPTCRLIPL